MEGGHPRARGEHHHHREHADGEHRSVEPDAGTRLDATEVTEGEAGREQRGDDPRDDRRERDRHRHRQHRRDHPLPRSQPDGDEDLTFLGPCGHVPRDGLERDDDRREGDDRGGDRQRDRHHPGQVADPGRFLRRAFDEELVVSGEDPLGRRDGLLGLPDPGAHEHHVGEAPDPVTAGRGPVEADRVTLLLPERAGEQDAAFVGQPQQLVRGADDTAHPEPELRTRRLADRLSLEDARADLLGRQRLEDQLVTRLQVVLLGHRLGDLDRPRVAVVERRSAEDRRTVERRPVRTVDRDPRLALGEDVGRGSFDLGEHDGEGRGRRYRWVGSELGEPLVGHLVGLHDHVGHGPGGPEPLHDTGGPPSPARQCQRHAGTEADHEHQHREPAPAAAGIGPCHHRRRGHHRRIIAPASPRANGRGQALSLWCQHHPRCPTGGRRATRPGRPGPPRPRRAGGCTRGGP